MRLRAVMQSRLALALWLDWEYAEALGYGDIWALYWQLCSGLIDWEGENFQW